MNWMILNHKALFELLATSNELTKVYDNNGFYSVQANNNVYPKLTLCCEQEKFQDKSFNNYVQAVESHLASPYIILQKNEHSLSINQLLKQKGFRAVEEWSSMSISLENIPKEKKENIQIIKVETDVQLQEWLMLVEKNLFNNSSIEIALFKQLLSNKNVVLWLGYINNQAVCTSLSFIHNNLVGLHMISTLLEFRGKGFGREITLRALQDASSKGISKGLLQATKLGINMYRKIGFQENGKFIIYWKVGKEYI